MKIYTLFFVTCALNGLFDVDGNIFNDDYQDIFEDSENNQDEDMQPPIVTDCPSNITRTTNNNYVIGNWPDPKATDDSGSVHVYVNRPKSSKFYLGGNKVTYVFSDGAGNEARCEFYVIVIKKKCSDAASGGLAAAMGWSCTAVAVDPTKCNSPLVKQARFLWKDLCKKTCKICN